MRARTILALIGAGVVVAGLVRRLAGRGSAHGIGPLAWHRGMAAATRSVAAEAMRKA